MAEFLRASLADIHVGERLRPVDQAYVEAIAASLAAQGQISPIMLRKTPAKNKGATPYTLVAGAYRTAAAKLLEWTEIDAIVVAADQAEAQLLEISENLYRNELNPLDRAIFVMTYRQLWEEKHGKIDRTKNLKVGQQLPKGNDCPSVFSPGRELSKTVQERLGFGDRTYKYVTSIGKNLHPLLRQAVRGTEAENDQSKLLKLARLPADDQVKVAAALREDPDLKPVLEWLKGPVKAIDPQKKLLDQMRSLWAKADVETRGAFLSDIGIDPLEYADEIAREAAE